MPQKPKPPLTRLLARCQWEGECLIWTGTTVRGLYGTFRPGTKESEPKVYVHRYVYEALVGPVPEGMELDHLCRRPRCVNVAHLEPVTHAENRRRSRLTVCRAGLHDLTDPDNQRWDSDGNRRGCAACHRDKSLARA